MMDHMLYQIFNTSPTIIYVNEIENRNIFKIKTRYYLHLLTPETMKLVESTKNKIRKDKNCDKKHFI